MQDGCRNCLAQEVCDITGDVCRKMDVLFAQRSSVTNGRITMTSNGKNTPKPSAPVEKSVAEKSNDVTNAVITGDDAEVIAAKVKETIPTQASGEQDSTADQTDEKLSLVQRTKAAVKKLGDNRTFMILLGTSLVVAGLTYKNNRKAVSNEPMDEAVGPIQGEDDATDDSI